MNPAISNNDMAYADIVKAHMGRYAQAKFPDRTKGLYRGIEKPYILRINPGESKDAVILKFNVIDGLKDRCIDLLQKPHTYAHHLNSSQIMCYNFFRRMMNVEDSCHDEIGWYGHPNDDLQRLVKEEIGAIISKKAKCRFEYVDEPKYEFIKADGVERGGKEMSNFDFYIEDGNTRIFFEIKYTENDFGGKNLNVSEDSLKNHESYFKTGYRNMIENTIIFDENMKDTLKKDIYRFNESYQLLRNVLRVDNSDTFSVFIFPYGNNPVRRKFKEFINEFSIDSSCVKGLCWEHLQSYMSEEFIHKYMNLEK